MRKQFKLGDRHFKIDWTGIHPLHGTIHEGEEVREFKLAAPASGSGRLHLGDRTVPYFVTGVAGGVWVTLAGETFFFENSKGKGGADDSHDGFAAPMPGKVIKVLVNQGDVVEKGQVLMVMEAMKMEHRIEAPGPGTVTAIHFQADDLVDQGVHLLDFQPEAS
ncbi:Biotin/lipoyl-binding protein [Sulfidibacter corallicola]|uniref:Biotin/lipoyl-binding protein n=1 Tax=Sulfidibacter corallicola TaxID=2818388 RepID=A0A8A4TL78_SULCO|nr:biotin/lipoyl-containing protein [Sulfidibacter corallicola]QTD49954.1 biotin/lipoyl-binding protein [Sulfidibacter corallicola]